MVASTLYTVPGDAPAWSTLDAIGAFLTANGWTLIDQDYATASSGRQRVWRHTVKGWVVTAATTGTAPSSISFHVGEGYDVPTHTLLAPARAGSFSYDAVGYPTGAAASVVNPATTSPIGNGFPAASSRVFMVTDPTDGHLVIGFEGAGSGPFVLTLDTYAPFSATGTTAKNLVVRAGNFTNGSGTANWFTQLPGITAAGSVAAPSSPNALVGTYDPPAALDAATGRPILSPLVVSVPHRVGAYAGTWSGLNANLFPVGRTEHLYVAWIGALAIAGDVLTAPDGDYFIIGGSTSVTNPSLAVKK